MYNRQISAPILKRKSSRFGLGQFLSGSSNANTANVASNIGHVQHHLQISSAPHTQVVHHHHQYHHSMHITQPQTTSAGTTPTTPNLLTEKQYQSGQSFSNNFGAQGRLEHVCCIRCNKVFFCIYKYLQFCQFTYS